MTTFITVTILWVFSVCLHEFGHAIVAYYGGDTSVKEKGYLTLNPLRYTHPVYSLLMPVIFMMLGGIGLPGGAVYIERDRLRSRKWETGVSLAGPTMNIVLILALSIPFWARLIPFDTDSVPAVSLAFLIQLQIYAVILNLIPVPPLDGFQAIAPWLPKDIRARLYAQSNIALWIMVLLLWYVPAVGHTFSSLVFAVMDALQIDPRLAVFGWREFQFWR
jgi:Zn-dependent protease